MWWHFMIGMLHLQAGEQIRFFYNGAANISHVQRFRRVRADMYLRHLSRQIFLRMMCEMPLISAFCIFTVLRHFSLDQKNSLIYKYPAMTREDHPDMAYSYVRVLLFYD